MVSSPQEGKKGKKKKKESPEKEHFISV